MHRWTDPRNLDFPHGQYHTEKGICCWRPGCKVRPLSPGRFHGQEISLDGGLTWQRATKIPPCSGA